MAVAVCMIVISLSARSDLSGHTARREAREGGSQGWRVAFSEGPLAEEPEPEASARRNHALNAVFACFGRRSRDLPAAGRSPLLSRGDRERAEGRTGISCRNCSEQNASCRQPHGHETDHFQWFSWE